MATAEQFIIWARSQVGAIEGLMVQAWDDSPPMTVEMIEADDGCGYAQLIVDPPPPMTGLILHTLFVDPADRGRGVGRELFDRVLARADVEGLPVLVAPVPDKDCPIDVEAWYARNGFVVTRSGMMMERLPSASPKMLAHQPPAGDPGTTTGLSG